MPTYLITGAAGFIPSALVGYLNERGTDDLILVDDFERYPAKAANLDGKRFRKKVSRDRLFEAWDAANWDLAGVYHLGARTDTAETDTELFDRLNLDYSKEVWRRCADRRIPLIYASSGATYGLGELGYRDDDELAERLEPLNAYGRSKNDFDKWVLTQDHRPPHYYGLKFFNVYGPNEYHKGRMASVVFHTFNQVRKTGAMKLFRSHNPEYKDGEQRRDFIYVKDLIAVCHWLMETRPDPSGLYNLGTGQSRTFRDLAAATFRALNREPNIGFIDTPADIRDKYQYFTEAEMGKLRAAGYDAPFTTLEDGITDYVQNYLAKNRYL